MAFENVSIKSKITVFSSMIVAAVVLSTSAYMSHTASMNLGRLLEEHVMDIARIAASDRTIQAWVGVPGGEEAIQPIAERIRENSNAEFVVVFDHDSRRYSHPIPSRIGKRIVGGDERAALEGQSYTSRAVGTLGPSLRGFEPVFNSGEQVGAVVVGILEADWRATVAAHQRYFVVAAMVGVVAATVGSAFLASSIKRAMYDLEPFEIAALLRQREAIIESVREGLIAVDGSGRIQVINSAARRMLGIGRTVLSEQVGTVIRNSRLPMVIESGEAEFDRDQTIGNVAIMVNRVPVWSDGIVVGAIGTFRTRSDMEELAESITGVQEYIQALRAQNHEFSNKLHTIAGLLEFGEIERALSFIEESATVQRGFATRLLETIEDSAISGLLFGKAGIAKENGVSLQVEPGSVLSNAHGIPRSHLISILGNLLDNAITAASTGGTRVSLGIFEEEAGVRLVICNDGESVDECETERLFEAGYSTKAEPGHGYGLLIVREAVESLGGSIEVTTSKGGHTVFSLFLPCHLEEGSG